MVTQKSAGQKMRLIPADQWSESDFLSKKEPERYKLFSKMWFTESQSVFAASD